MTLAGCFTYFRLLLHFTPQVVQYFYETGIDDREKICFLNKWQKQSTRNLTLCGVVIALNTEREHNMKNYVSQINVFERLIHALK